MHRIAKILWMIFIFWMVFFIIRDEKWYKIWFENGHIVFDEVEKKSKFTENDKLRTQLNPNVIYKNSDLIQINYEFENPKELRYAKWVDKERLAQIREEKKIEEKITKEQTEKFTWDEERNLNISNISSLFEKTDGQNNKIIEEDFTEREDKKAENIVEFWNKIKKNASDSETIDAHPITWSYLDDSWKDIEENKVPIVYPFEKYYLDKHILTLKNWDFEEYDKNYESQRVIDDILYEVEKHNLSIHDLNLKSGKMSENILFNNNVYTWTESKNWKTLEPLSTFDDNNESDHQYDRIENSQDLNYDMEAISEQNGWNVGYISGWVEAEDALYKVERYEYPLHIIKIKDAVKMDFSTENSNINHTMNKRVMLSSYSSDANDKINQNPVLFKVDKYQFSRHYLNLRVWIAIKHEFVVNDVEDESNWLPDSMLENLLKNDEIDLNSLESENDEFLQKVFEKTRDINVMNLIVETYLNEYQFVKAKKFIEDLPEDYRDKLKPSLNLRVAFNSFSLSSKTNNESLTSLIHGYSSKNEISTEDKNRYLWVIALMDRNYDNFFEISKWFTSAANKAFSVKLQWYKDQIDKQMWMPAYYFDTLVSLELFNQWLFQPAKVLSLYSLQQNSEYILPYQILSYANFLTNSWDTSIAYLKKLVDLDPNNAEKYRFLMWVVFYRDEKYEQSVVMLSMIKDEKLRLDTQRYLINNYLKLDQKTKLISSRNKLLWYENLIASDFYTYFYETFFHPYSQWEEFQLYAYDTELANKMLRICSIILNNEEKAVCTYGTIGRNIALWQFNGLEQYLLDLVAEYPQWYLYQALWDYYIQQWDLEKAKAYLIKAISLTPKKSERSQIKKLLQDTM